MAEVTTAPGLPPAGNYSPYPHEEKHMSNLSEPRSNPTPSPSSPTHPDLSREVETLSNKLINAINHQTDLDDNLSHTRHLLQEALDRVKLLEGQVEEHNDLVARGVLVQRTELDKVNATLAGERKEYANMEKEKKAIELELENLTSALFEEANKMVITARENARHEYEILQKKNDLLKAQLAESQSLLESSHEQLAELKQVVEQITSERDDTTNPTAPSTPGLGRFEGATDGQSESAPSSQVLETPSYPTSFTHLLHPVLRFDLTSYDEFTTLLRVPKTTVGSRASSGSYSGLGLGLGLGGYAPSSVVSNGSNSSLPTPATATSPGSPATPASAVSNVSTGATVSLPPLKDTKFYKRALAEDIEPTLRLDTAPGLSWLARRSVLNAMCEGSLVVEPMPSSVTSTFKLFTYPCALCGETRKDPEHIRTHRFKTSENDNAQRYPLCKYCHGRVRSTCDFLGFLRILHKGHWPTDGEDSEKAAWEESVRLREQMFWCRMGGGVLPGPPNPTSNASVTGRSPRVSEEAHKKEEAAKELEPVLEKESIETPTEAVEAVVESTAESLKDESPAEAPDTSPRSAGPSPVFKNIEARNPYKMTRSKPGQKIIIGGSRRGSEEEVPTTSSPEEQPIEKAEETTQPSEEISEINTSNPSRDSSPAPSPLPVTEPEDQVGTPEVDEAQRLSQSIPGGF